MHRMGSEENDIRGYEICGSDKIFIPASAKLDNNNLKIILSSDKIQNPIAARYCFRNFQPGNLANTRGLPVVPFRTDNF